MVEPTVNLRVNLIEVSGGLVYRIFGGIGGGSCLCLFV